MLPHVTIVFPNGLRTVRIRSKNEPLLPLLPLLPPLLPPLLLLLLLLLHSRRPLLFNESVSFKNGAAERFGNRLSKCGLFNASTKAGLELTDARVTNALEERVGRTSQLRIRFRSWYVVLSLSPPTRHIHIHTGV